MQRFHYCLWALTLRAGRVYGIGMEKTTVATAQIEDIGQLLLAAKVDGREKSILDVGCGSGEWLLAAAAMCPQAELVGFDPYEPALEEAAQAAQAKGIKANWHHLDFDQAMEAFKGRRFDLIMCNSVFHYLDRSTSLKLMGAMLSERGALVIYNTHRVGYYLSRTLRYGLRGDFKRFYYYSRPLRWTHLRNLLLGRHDGETWMSPRHLARHGAEAGLVMEEIPSPPNYSGRFLGFRVGISVRFTKAA